MHRWRLEWIVVLCLLWVQPIYARERYNGICEQGNVSVAIPGTVGSGTQRFQRSFPSCTVTIYLAGTMNLATIYSDNAGTALANPFTADANGRFFFYADNGNYDVRLSGAGIASPFTVGDNQLGGPTLDCANYPGANAAVKINNCHTDLPVTGGILDASRIVGAQTLGATVTLSKPARLILGPGTFTFAGTSPIFSISGSGAGLECMSPFATVIVSAADVVGANLSSNTFVRNCTLRGPNLDGTLSGINSGNANNVMIEGNVIEQWGLDGINQGGNSSNWIIRGNFIRNNYDSGVFLPGGDNSRNIVANNVIRDNGAIGIDINGSYNTIIGNFVFNNGANYSKIGLDCWGILIAAVPGTNSNYNTVTGNTVDANKCHNIIVRPTTGQTANYNTITGNMSTGASGSANPNGIVIDGTAAGTLRGNVISSNIVRGNVGDGIRLDGITGTVQENIVIGNVVEANMLYGVVIADANAIDNQILNNTIVDNSSGAFYTTNSVRTLVFCNKTSTSVNQCDMQLGTLATNDMRPFSGAVTTFTSAGNTEFRWTSSAGGARNYSWFIDTSGNFRAYDATAAAVRLNIDSAGNIDAISNFTVGSGNYLNKMLTGTANLNFGNTLAQTSSDLTIAVMGALNEMPCMVGVGAAIYPANTTFTCFVSAADTVTVRFNNYSSGAVNPGADNFRVFLVGF